MSRHYRNTIDRFTMSYFSGENNVYLSFPETDAGESGALLIDGATLVRLMQSTYLMEGMNWID